MFLKTYFCESKISFSAHNIFINSIPFNIYTAYLRGRHCPVSFFYVTSFTIETASLSSALSKFLWEQSIIWLDSWNDDIILFFLSPRLSLGKESEGVCAQNQDN